MNRLRLSIFILISLMLLPFQAYALTTHNCDYLTGGNTRALDYLSVSDLSNGDRAIVLFISGTSRYLGIFQYDSSGTTTENTSTHPYYIRPNDYSSSGVWAEIPLSWVDLVTTLSIANLTVTSTLTVNNVSASGNLSGGVVFEAATGTSTISGTSLYGGYIYGWGGTPGIATSGATRILPTATGDGENVTFYTVGNTYSSGGTLYVHFTSGDTLYCNQTITAGTSKFILSGTSSFDTQIICVSTLPNYWHVKTVGAPTVDWD